MPLHNLSHKTGQDIIELLESVDTKLADKVKEQCWKGGFYFDNTKPTWREVKLKEFQNIKEQSDHIADTSEKVLENELENGFKFPIVQNHVPDIGKEVANDPERLAKVLKDFQPVAESILNEPETVKVKVGDIVTVKTRDPKGNFTHPVDIGLIDVYAFIVCEVTDVAESRIMLDGKEDYVISVRSGWFDNRKESNVFLSEIAYVLPKQNVTI